MCWQHVNGWPGSVILREESVITAKHVCPLCELLAALPVCGRIPRLRRLPAKCYRSDRMDDVDISAAFDDLRDPTCVAPGTLRLRAAAGTHVESRRRCHRVRDPASKLAVGCSVIVSLSVVSRCAPARNW